MLEGGEGEGKEGKEIFGTRRFGFGGEASWGDKD